MAKKTKGKLSSSEEAFLEPVPDLETKVNGLGDSDVASEPFSFTCTKRDYDSYRDGYNYYVTPDEDYDVLDFQGHDVLINGVTRRCEEFSITEDGHVIIYVPYLTGG